MPLDALAQAERLKGGARGGVAKVGARILRVSMIPLPIDSYLPGIVEALRRSRALVIVAPPGAGKTTRVPVAMLRGGLVEGEHRNIVMLQPRRVAARASAARIAQENA